MQFQTFILFSAHFSFLVMVSSNLTVYWILNSYLKKGISLFSLHQNFKLSFIYLTPG